jgi:hypothetical protein
LAVLELPSLVAVAEIESVKSFNIKFYTQPRIISGQEHLLELENSINTHEKVVLFYGHVVLQ